MWNRKCKKCIICFALTCGFVLCLTCVLLYYVFCFNVWFILNKQVGSMFQTQYKNTWVWYFKHISKTRGFDIPIILRKHACFLFYSSFHVVMLSCRHFMFVQLMLVRLASLESMSKLFLCEHVSSHLNHLFLSFCILL